MSELQHSIRTRTASPLVDAETAKFDAELIRVRVARPKACTEDNTESVEDVHSLLPGVAGRVEIAVGVARIAKVAESGRLGIAMAEFPLQAEGLLVVGDGLFHHPMPFGPIRIKGGEHYML